MCRGQAIKIRIGLAAGLWLVCTGLITTGCGYTSKSLFPEHVRTVSVPIFENRTFYRTIEFDLTEALIKELELRSPYKVTDVDKADTIIKGSIATIEQTRLSRQSIGDVPQEMEVRIVVDFEWKHPHSGKTLQHRSGLEAVGRYLPTESSAEPLDVALQQAVGKLAVRIVSLMAGEW